MTKASLKTAPPPGQEAGLGQPEYEITSLAENERAILVGRGWECVGYWTWRVVSSRSRRAPATAGGVSDRDARSPAPHGPRAGLAGDGGAPEKRRLREYYDLSRKNPARIPGHDAPTHFRPLRPIDIEALGARVSPRLVDVRGRPSPAHIVMTEDEGGSADAAWPYAYAEPGYICRDEAEHRMIRGLRTAASPGVVKNVHTGYKSNWPVAQMVSGWGDYAPAITVREFTPTRRDLDDWWLALGWFAALSPPASRADTWQPGQFNLSQTIIAWRAAVPAYSWRQIGDQLGRSNEWARRRYQSAIDRAWQKANEGADG